DEPESYFVLISQHRFPNGLLGRLLIHVYEIKLIVLEYLITPLQDN
ncbi:MAG: putative quorum-sensing-regulated virulence factor, partial [Pseudobdellovibrionaceae bacterium]